MKIERLLGIITFLLNREVVTGKYLADKFEVSERTIQRDIESINLAGIPIVSLRGVNGGYQILDQYGFSKQASTLDDLRVIRSALDTLGSVVENEKIHRTLEKVKSIDDSNQSSALSVDFSIVKENKKVLTYLPTVEQAIHSHTVLAFMYTNASNVQKKHIVEPVSLKFKWYAWYLIAYHKEKKEYRIYKLSRMTELVNLNQSFAKVHCDKTDYFELLMQNDTRESSRLVIKMKRNIFVSFSEYFNAFSIILEDDKNIEVELDVIESERHWFAILLSFGADLEIISPEAVREKFYNHSKKIYTLYDKPDR